MWVLVCLVLGVLLLAYYWWTAKYDYWKSRGFPYLEPSFPFGNMKERILFTKYIGYALQDIYQKTTPHPYVGLIALRTPQLLIRDPKIIKHIMVKDFLHWRNRFNIEPRDPIGYHLFNLSGDKWKAMRVKLTPTFTSGKLKIMFSLFQACASQLDKLLEEKASNSEVVDIKDLIARFTTDIIGSCAFGLEINSMFDPDNEFRKIGATVFPSEPSLGAKIKLAITALLPGLDKTYRLSIMQNEVSRFIFSVVKDTVEYREKNNVKRNDFLDLLIELKNKGKIESPGNDPSEEKELGVSGSVKQFEMTMDLLTAQCFVFFIAGFETSSSVQSYCMYELAINQDIQERLSNEIDEMTRKHGGLTYQAIQEMTYLDQVVSETMRKYPTLPFLNRTCSKTYRMPDTDLVVEEGTRVLIPVYALHHDPEYFPDPEKFDPDRFSAERKSSIKQYTYMPFGEGPRLCIGMRFGLLQTKTGLCTVLSKYRLLPSDETKIPIGFASSVLVTTTDGPIKLLVKHRFRK